MVSLATRYVSPLIGTGPMWMASSDSRKYSPLGAKAWTEGLVFFVVVVVGGGGGGGPHLIDVKNV
jgi:hypothetical protein